MCLGIPMQVLHCDGSTALCADRAGAQARVDLLLTGPQPPGTWLLTFLGAAREVLEPARAAQIGAALGALQALLEGRPADLDAAFADLAGREPQLPEFLRDPT